MLKKANTHMALFSALQIYAVKLSMEAFFCVNTTDMSNGNVLDSMPMPMVFVIAKSMPMSMPMVF